MTNYELKMPANYAAIDAEEMTYLVGGETTGWQMFKDIGTLFNYIARVFSAGSSIINNVVTIVDTVKKINSFVSGFPALGCSFVVKTQKDVLQKEEIMKSRNCDKES